MDRGEGVVEVVYYFDGMCYVGMGEGGFERTRIQLTFGGFVEHWYTSMIILLMFNRCK